MEVTRRLYLNFSNFHCTVKSPVSVDQQQQYHVENYFILWLNTNSGEDTDYQNSVSQLCNALDVSKIFNNADECIDYITDICDEKVHFIVSIAFLDQIIPLIHELPQIDSIYILNLNKKIECEQWMKQYEKIVGIFPNMESIYDKLESNVKIIAAKQIGLMSISTVRDGDNINKQEVLFMYSTLLKEIFVQMENSANVKCEMVEFCRSQYSDNDYQLKIIDEFDKDYCAAEAVKWYTRDCFLFRMLNKALRILDIETLYKVRFFIKDLHQQLQSESLSAIGSVTDVYRGQLMYAVEFEKLKTNIGGLLSVSNFLSTTPHRELALCFSGFGTFECCICFISHMH
ncbi:unnamed protein product [Didymodactylos carnosus]|uniref:Uncharacterized protein n=1 Tax=Didymodactylos carnosus TaxID=1234261 RepID=A0A815FWL9_9BILA|nr:unnamed protein product [Didymodactylos carnosus]CAF1378344.1 unnamed protein product [Didymodactylos carnosus]CAF4184292.1 unnamed protein product [Didymodactylos carnosus]CAF4187034.1 unnamed protein product [Didymodactylos carnosus]